MVDSPRRNVARSFGVEEPERHGGRVARDPGYCAGGVDDEGGGVGGVEDVVEVDDCVCAFAGASVGSHGGMGGGGRMW